MAISLTESITIGIADIMMRKVRSIVTIIGIILGVMCIMVVLAIVSGMEKSTMEWMLQRGGLSKIEVYRNWLYDFKQGGDASLTMQEIQYLRQQIPEARAFNPQVSLYNAQIGVQGNSFSGECFGVMPDMQIVENWTVSEGRFINEIDIRENNGVAVLGKISARRLFGSANPIGQNISINGIVFKVIGVLEEKVWINQGSNLKENLLEYMNNYTYVPVSTMMSKLSPGSKVTSLEITAQSPDHAIALQKKVERIILGIKRGKKVFQVDSAQEDMQEMKKNALIFTVIFVQIALVSLLVGGIVIMNIMLASIKERTREIGVRIAVGARRFDIFVQFLVQTILITVLGGVLGIIFGYLILDLVSSYLSITMVASAQMIFIALAVSVGVGLIFGIAPAIRASKLDPVVALREE